jgi:hypothetical protein
MEALEVKLRLHVVIPHARANLRVRHAARLEEACIACAEQGNTAGQGRARGSLTVSWLRGPCMLGRATLSATDYGEGASAE